METNTTQHNIREKVTEAIRSGKVTMHSSFHFIVKTILLFTALVGIFVLSSVILNFILFSIRVQSHHELLGFGSLGILAFLHFFPWLLFCIDVGLIVLVLSLMRSFHVGYKVPLLYLGGALFAGVLFVGFLVEETNEPLNTRFMHRAEEGTLPAPLPRMMGGSGLVGEHKRPLCRCEVINVHGDGVLIAKDIRTGRFFTFKIASYTPYATTSNLLPGDIIIIAGLHDGDGDRDDVIEAYGLKKLVIPRD